MRARSEESSVRRRHFIASVKAYGYGYGTLPVVRAVLDNGADMIAVGNLEEAIRVRRNGIKAPILVFGNALDDALTHYLEHDLIPAVFNFSTAETLSRIATKDVTVYVKVETGLGRLGVAAEDAPMFVKRMLTLPRIRIGGIYTHLGPNAGVKDKTYAEWQFQRFTDAVSALESEGIHIPVQQAANSSAILDMPHTYMTAVCPGAALYGMVETQAPKVQATFNVPFIALKSCIIQVREVPTGYNVSGMVTGRTSLIATIPIGHADGYANVHAGGHVLVHGMRVPIVSALSLEHTKLDVTDVPGVAVGDEVVLIGSQGSQTITLGDAAKTANRQVRELLSGFVCKLPYVCFRDGKAVWLSWHLGEVNLAGS